GWLRCSRCAARLIAPSSESATRVRRTRTSSPAITPGYRRCSGSDLDGDPLAGVGWSHGTDGRVRVKTMTTATPVTKPVLTEGAARAGVDAALAKAVEMGLAVTVS